MNVGSYHQHQHQQLLQFNIHQHQSSLPIGSNEADNKMNSHNIPKYPREGMNVMGPQGNTGIPSMPPSVDQLTQNVNKMSVQENTIYKHPQFPPQMMDQNKNMASNENLYSPNNYGDGPQINSRKMPPLPSGNASNALPDPTPLPNNYPWNQPTNTNSYPNNNLVSNNQQTSYSFTDGPQTMSNSTPARPPSAHQMNNFPPPPQSKSFSPALQNSSFPPPPTPNNSFSSPPSQNHANNSFPPPQSKSFSPAPHNNSFPGPAPLNNSFSSSAAQNNSYSGAPPVGKPFPPPVSQNSSFPPGPPSSSFSAPKPQTTAFPPSAHVNNSYPPPPGSQANSFPPSATQTNSFPPPMSQANSFPSQQGSSFPPASTSQTASFPPSASQNTRFPPGPQNASSPPSGLQNASFPPAGSQPPFSSAGPPSHSFPPSTAYPSPANNQMYSPGVNTNGLPAQPSFPQYNQKSAFSPPYSKNVAGGPDQGNMMPPQQMSSHSGPYGGMPQQQQQPQRRLDPDQMPNPIQVMKEDQELRSNEPFVTNQPGLVPPMVTTNFIVEDEGNANPRFMRSTMYNVPCNMDMMKQADVPFSLVITPLATLPPEEQLPPIVNTDEFGPVRCVRCKAYVNPYMKFVDGGRRFVCVLCKAVTEVPAEYFQHLDHTGNRVDRYERPELLYGAYEFTVTKEYCKDNEVPNVPALIFVIDVSYNNMKSGMVKILCEQMADIVQNYMPTDDNGQDNPRMRVGFITYDSTVHFYNIKACLGQPQMMIVGDMEDVFVPLLDGFLCDPIESLPVIESLMQQIPATFAETRETDTILLPAIQAGLEALKAAKCAGKLLVFHSSLPTANAPGKLVNREDRKLLGTEKEKVQLAPQNSTYTSLAQECVTAGCSVDLFVFNNAPIDLATIGQVTKLTGGEVYKYTYFQADIDGERLIEDVKRDTSRKIAFDAVMRVRTSAGVRPVSFFGHMHMSNTTDIELASINADKSIAVEIKHDDKLVEEDGVFIQVALLFTSCGGQRRVRILNLALKCCSQIADLFRHCELDTMINYLSKAAVTKLMEGTPRQVKEGLTTKCARTLACYRRLCANPCSPGQLILPECMKLLPLYINCLLKSDAISGGSDMTVDDRWYMMQNVLTIDIPSSVNYFYPRLIPLVNIDYYSDEIPVPIRCTSYRLSNSEAYLLDNGIYMFLWLGSQVPTEWLNNVFGVADASLITSNIAKIPLFDNVHSKKISSLISHVQRERRHTMKLTIVRENDKMEIVFKHFLVEDGISGAIGDNLSASSYVDFLCHMHKEIRNMLS